MPSFTVFKGHESGLPKKHTITKPDELTGDNVLVKVTASGLCGTGTPPLPNMVLGHEGVGIVKRLGPNTRHLQVGDRVAWGYETDSCGHCLECLQGTETFCPERALYGASNLDQGSFASHGIWREAFLHVVPASLTDAEAAPLQCGGATMFSALQGVKPSDTVGILGVGGLGHLAIQFAAKMGCRVVVLSGSERKREEAMKLGAHEFVAMKDAKELQVGAKLNRLLVTAAVPPDWSLLLPVLAARSAIYPLSVAMGNFEIPYLSLILQGITVVGSLVATRSVHREMLEFAALHQIKPIVETYPMTEEGIAEAMEKLDKGQVYYRAVLVPQ
ncbi:hypothetical protein FE257_004537 [Aspergillus nanangensis]|uniref:Enoyl reductase (ER) domain-containing protein n=1 Tax=Aspergillus nanangensis TaxID=2582783 RepID=A0AAD4CY74_ASPNN|nr:hypothetical protein FE257_004537 [Aspergillus nanangensis]